MTFPTLQIVKRPGILELGWGHPDPALLPVEAMRRAMSAALDKHGADGLQYGSTRGAGPLLEWLSARIGQHEGRAPDGDEIILTGGNSFGLDALLTLTTKPGDAALVESPTYHLALRILQDHQLELVPIPSDDEGMQVTAVAEALDKLRQAGKRARVLYTVPTYNNPTGISLSDQRRRDLVALAETQELLVIEDDVYRELAYDGPAPDSLWSIAPKGTVARIGSFSKSVAPGLRLGWMTAPSALIDQMMAGGALDSGGGINPFTALAVAELCESGGFDQQVATLRAAYRERRDTLAAALKESLPDGSRVESPGGGFFMWVTLPSEINSEALTPEAEAEGVAYVPGARFHSDGGGLNSLRLAFSLYLPEELAEAARRLGRAVSRFTQGSG